MDYLTRKIENNTLFVANEFNELIENLLNSNNRFCYVSEYNGIEYQLYNSLNDGTDNECNLSISMDDFCIIVVNPIFTLGYGNAIFIKGIGWCNGQHITIKSDILSNWMGDIYSNIDKH